MRSLIKSFEEQAVHIDRSGDVEHRNDKNSKRKSGKPGSSKHKIQSSQESSSNEEHKKNGDNSEQRTEPWNPI